MQLEMRVCPGNGQTENQPAPYQTVSNDTIGFVLNFSTDAPKHIDTRFNVGDRRACIRYTTDPRETSPHPGLTHGAGNGVKTSLSPFALRALVIEDRGLYKIVFALPDGSRIRTFAGNLDEIADQLQIAGANLGFSIGHSALYWCLRAFAEQAWWIALAGGRQP